MVKLSETEMIKIIKEKTISACTDEEKKQIYVFAFGEEYMRQPDNLKGRRQILREQTNADI